jgi:oligopeptide/dipeptide ABC transporter ATP-binding protein
LLSFRNVRAAIGGHVLLEDVSLQLRRGTTLGVVGESGSGKSLTLRVVLGLLGRIGADVIGGEATFDGVDLLRLQPSEWRDLRGARIGFVPQNSSVLLNPVRRIGSQVRETVARLDPGVPSAARARELLEAVRIPRVDDVLRMYPHEISGGMLQRVMIALAIAGRPTLLVADEPTTALDVTVQKAVLELFSELKSEFSMSMVFVSHDLDVVRTVSDDLAVMYAGATVEAGPVDAVLAAPRHPYTRALIAAHPGLATDGLSEGIPGAPPTAEDRPAGCQFAPRCPLVVERCTQQSVRLETVGLPWPVACIRAREQVPA